MKRILYIISALLVIFITANSVYVYGLDNSAVSTNPPPVPKDRQLPRLADYADLLTDKEETKLLMLLNEISERQKCDVIIVTVPTLDGKTSLNYAHDFYDYNGYGFGDEDSGILLLICPEERDWAISTYGFGITAFTDAGQEFIMNAVRPSLSSESFYKAFKFFADFCDEYITEAREGQPYDIGHMPPGRMLQPVNNLIFSFLISIPIAWRSVRKKKKALISTELQTKADNYIHQGSLQLTAQSDTFLYENISKTPMTEDTGSGSVSGTSSGSGSRGGSSTYTSSSGRKHGGSSGKY